MKQLFRNGMPTQILAVANANSGFEDQARSAAAYAGEFQADRIIFGAYHDEWIERRIVIPAIAKRMRAAAQATGELPHDIKTHVLETSASYMSLLVGTALYIERGKRLGVIDRRQDAPRTAWACYQLFPDTPILPLRSDGKVQTIREMMTSLADREKARWNYYGVTSGDLDGFRERERELRGEAIELHTRDSSAQVIEFGPPQPSKE